MAFKYNKQKTVLEGYNVKKRFCLVMVLLTITLFGNCSENTTKENEITQFNGGTEMSDYRASEMKNTDETKIAEIIDTTDFSDEFTPVYDESKMPDDFYFVFETSGAIEYKDEHDNSGYLPPYVLMDTKYNIIAKYNPLCPIGHNYAQLQETGLFGYFSTDFRISEENLKQVYDNIIKYNIRDLNSRTTGNDKWIVRRIDEYLDILPNNGNIPFRITFHINEKLYTVVYDYTVVIALEINPESENYPLANLALFHKFLWDFYIGTEEYQSFPVYEIDWNKEPPEMTE